MLIFRSYPPPLDSSTTQCVGSVLSVSISFSSTLSLGISLCTMKGGTTDKAFQAFQEQERCSCSCGHAQEEKKNPLGKGKN